MDYTLYVVSHTHWDREWYESFQNYRYRLVRMIDDLLNLLENDPEFKVFHFDGQTIVLRDYLEIRPENEARLRKQIKDGRIVIGPWYVMPDEFLIAGESLIKNLQLGHEICTEYGARPMKNGYVTDIFGHNSQFPQILRGFGISAATLYRGIGDFRPDAFTWRAADGSEVTAAKLDRERSYSNFYFAVRWPFEDGGATDEKLVTHMKHLLEHSIPLATSDCILMMDGCDHLDAERGLPSLIKLFERELPGVKFKHCCIDEYFAALANKQVKLDTITGPLYNLAYTGVNNQVLKNVLSSMVILKQQNDECERLLTNYAEPLDAFTYMLGEKTPLGINDYFASPRDGYFKRAWDFLLQNQPHDSICGCSASETHEDNLNRFKQSRELGNLMLRDAMFELARELEPSPLAKNGSVLVYNPTQTALSGCFTAKLITPAGAGDNVKFYDENGAELRFQTISTRGYIQPVHRLRKLIQAHSHEERTVIIEGTVPGAGYKALSYEVVPGNGFDEYSYGIKDVNHPKRLMGSMFTSRGNLDNGIYNIKIDDAGRLDITVKASGRTFSGLHAFEDCGDAGDGWNYRHPRFDAKVNDTAAKRVAVISDGPLGAVLRVTKSLEVPARNSERGKTAPETETLEIVTDITITKDNPVISFRTSFENTAREHRLRVLFPTGLSADAFYTKTPFDMCRWPISAGDYSEHTEEETFVHPSQGVTFITDALNSTSVYAKGLYEVEVTDDASHTIALTLMRSPANETWNETRLTALLRPLEFEYALSFYDSCPAQAFVHGEAWRNPPISVYCAESSTSGKLPRAGSFVKLSSDTVLLSAVKHTKDGIELRLLETAGIKQSVEITLNQPVKSAVYVDLLGNKITDASVTDGKVKAELSSKQFITLRVII
jgi:Alpha-mannosidase